MTIGSSTVLAIVAAALATLVWWVAGRLNAPGWACQFLFGAVLVLVLLAGPLVRLP
jgi:hypothetical protein